jgi:predicted aspartyl protease
LGALPSENTLIGIGGRVRGRMLSFLFDTGASCNFISADLTRELNLWKFVSTDASNVRLANGKELSCVGTIELFIKFPKLRWKS